MGLLELLGLKAAPSTNTQNFSGVNPTVIAPEEDVITINFADPNILTPVVQQQLLLPEYQPAAERIFIGKHGGLVYRIFIPSQIPNLPQKLQISNEEQTSAYGRLDRDMVNYIEAADIVAKKHRLNLLSITQGEFIKPYDHSPFSFSASIGFQGFALKKDLDQFFRMLKSEKPELDAAANKYTASRDYFAKVFNLDGENASD